MLQIYALRAAIVIIASFSALSSVIGLGSIFQAIFYPMIVIGIGLELAKYSAITYVYTNYTVLDWKLRIGAWIFIPALVLFTSLGIYGYLGSAFSDSNIARQKNQVVVEALVKQKAKLEEHLSSIDKQIAELPSNFVSGRVKLLESFKTDKNHDQVELDDINVKLTKYQLDTLDVQSHMGVIMFVASAVNVPIEKAIATLILCLTLCLDPFAIYLTMLANKRSITHDDPKPIVAAIAEPVPVVAPLIEPVMSPEEFNQAQTDEFIRNQVAQEEEADTAAQDVIDEINMQIAEAVEPPIDPYIPESEPPAAIEENAKYLAMSGVEADTFESMEIDKEPKLVPAVEEVAPVTDAPRVMDAMPHPGRNKHVSEIHADNALPLSGHAAHTDFGNVFPTHPEKGDVYLRTDSLPNRLFKYNGFKWIEVSRDAIEYDQQYIEHLIGKISKGEYDIDLLTADEQEQIRNYLDSLDKGTMPT